MLGDPALTQIAALAAAAYARCLDFRDWDWLPELFTDGATLVDPGLTGSWSGGAATVYRDSAAIQAAVAQRPEGLRTRQVITNSFAEGSGPDALRAVHYVTLWRHIDPALGLRPAPLGGPWIVGHWQDRLQRQGDGWVFSSRTLVPAFVAGDG